MVHMHSRCQNFNMYKLQIPILNIQICINCLMQTENGKPKYIGVIINDKINMDFTNYHKSSLDL